MSQLVEEVQPKIATFPPEIVDKVLLHLVCQLPWREFPRCVANIRSHIYSHSADVYTLATLSLVCQAWRGPAQRRMMSHIVVRSGRHANRLARPAFVRSGLHVYVQEIVIRDFGLKKFNGVTVAQLVALLSRLTNATSLIVYTPTSVAFRKSDATILATSPPWSHLRKIGFYGDWTEFTTPIFHAILSTSLYLTELHITLLYKFGRFEALNLDPINLRHLTKLRLGDHSGSDLILWLLTPLTFGGLREFIWQSDRALEASLGRIIERMGPSLRKLSYSVVDGKTASPVLGEAGEFDGCTGLEEISLDFSDFLHPTGRSCARIEKYPSTVRIISIVHYTVGLPAALLGEWGKLARHPSSLRTLTIVEQLPGFFMEKETRSCLDFCEAAGVELIIELAKEQ
ncbi:hypothetical protein P7C70_g4447, partial [Phenoliferia sp. Uapishka_3]